MLREQCLERCAVMPGEPPSDPSLEKARERLITDTLALQEQRKLDLGQVDNAALAEALGQASRRLAECPSPCREQVTAKDLSGWVERKLLVREFLRRRVAVFVEVTDEEVRREVRRRTAAGAPEAERTEEKVREDLQAEKVALEVRNWDQRAASKSRIILSPLEDR